MAGHTTEGLLGADDPVPVGLFNAAGSSPFLLIGDHAGSAVPDALGDLGLTAADRGRHIAIDIGVYGLGHALAALLDAPFLHQLYSRLVIDCNRDPAQPEAIPALSDGSQIAGNAGLDAAARAARIAAIHEPYQAAITATIAERQAAGRATILLSLHSFTPVMDGIARPWDVGVLLWLGRTDFARAMLDALRADAALTVGDNQPYQMDATDHTVPRHAFPHQLPYAEIEVRQDLIGDAVGQHLWAQRLAQAAQSGAARIGYGSNAAAGGL
ncbi:N-formylglutamate amidohydrolase [Sphingomonas bisphenolicum]|uniref:N-formylglutamate amidohydrolase n=1 Tax=Sphingomonas bisphenolicum TaxID=296544 RepID=A0ABN5W732_9SPHN|nr:N-formylglutamate amidohydrolase [Sphingomonas bisphenolicum]BBF68044.1 N-formylglutamate amidohydrolase [Sphingomonas bisphenolicum]